MEEIFTVLKQMIPISTAGSVLSKLDLLQSVIDYIMDLEHQLNDSTDLNDLTYLLENFKTE